MSSEQKEALKSEAQNSPIHQPPTDDGSASLKAFRDARPPAINDAPLYQGGKQTHLLNCSFCTVGAMTNKKASDVAKDHIEQNYSKHASLSDDKKRASQEMTVWSDPAQNPDNTTAAYDFKGQLDGMGGYLKKYADNPANKVTFKQDTPLEPGTNKPTPYSKDELLQRMDAHPNGTRFGVMVFGSEANQTHWVQAEKYNGNLVFQDFQQNAKMDVMKNGRPTGEQATNQTRITNNRLPVGPVDGKDIYQSGMFFALEPTKS
ncbi:hypothetical protein [Cystobacter fuscus]|uniref:hypothetical protein n=1 Tax=Cystobacter fuscus TaxID=43 RepID=UPI0037BFE8ED